MKDRRTADGTDGCGTDDGHGKDSLPSGCEALLELLGLGEKTVPSLDAELDRWLDEVLGKDGHGNGRDNI